MWVTLKRLAMVEPAPDRVVFLMPAKSLPPLPGPEKYDQLFTYIRKKLVLPFPTFAGIGHAENSTSNC
jgi:hypothetical protein